MEEIKVKATLEIENDDAQKTGSKIAKGIADALSKLGIGSKITSAIGSGGGAFEGGADMAGTLGVIAAGIATGVGVVAAILDALNIFTPVMKILKVILMLLFLPLLPFFKLALQAMIKMESQLAPFVSKVTDLVQQTSGNNAGAALGAGILGVIAVLAEAVGMIAVGFVKWWWNLWSGVGVQLSNLTIKAFDGILSLIGDAWTKLAQLGSSLISLIMNGWSFLSKIGELIWMTIIEPAFNFLVDVGKWIWNQILSPAFHWLDNIGQLIWNILITPFQWLAQQIHNVISFFGGGGSSKTVGDAIITPSGVINTNPNDYIIATTNPSGLGGGSGQTIINYNIDSPTISSPQDIKDLVNRINMYQQKQMRRTTNYVGGY